ncbi:MAG: hypothetical protein PVTTEEND_000978 [Candidatus Fervidibacter sp.]
MRQLGITVRWRDLRRQPPTESELQQLLGNRPVEMFLSRTCPLKERLPKLSRKEAIAMLAQHPEWLRRPMVIAGGQIVVGYDEAALRALAGRL